MIRKDLSPLIRETAGKIRPVSEKYRLLCRKRWDSLCKPIGGFGVLEDLVCRLGAIEETVFPDISRAAVVIMGADNGVVAEGVSQCGSEVTSRVLANMAEKKSSVCVMSKYRKADVIPVDIGTNAPVQAEGVLDRAVRRGTGDILKGPAMSRPEAEKSIETGILLAGKLKEQGYRILIPGEMGIGNTTTSAACVCALFDRDPGLVTGRGAGLTDRGLRRKTEVVRQAMRTNFPDGTGDADIIDVLARLGGLDIGGMCGLFLGAAEQKMPVIVDGFIAALSAYMAAVLAPQSRQYMLPGHGSSEPGDRILLEALHMDPPIRLGMHLGEGTGAALLLPVLDEALFVYENLPVFSESGIEAYKHLS